MMIVSQNSSIDANSALPMTESDEVLESQFVSEVLSNHLIIIFE
jgi:hypothetical protein